MTLWWIGDALLLVVILPLVVYLLHNVYGAASTIARSVTRIADAAAAGSRDLDAVPLLLTTQDQVRRTVGSVAAYGGALDTIVDDASEES